MNWRKIAVGVVAVGVLWFAVWLLLLFMKSPEQQMLRMHNKFITALENRKWGTIDSMISKDYNDGVIEDPAQVKAAIRKVLGGFIGLAITQEVVGTKGAWAQGKVYVGMVRTKIKVEGNGAGLSTFVVSESKRMTHPWVFHWHKRGPWPWSWELMQIYNDQLAIPDGAMELLNGQ